MVPTSYTVSEYVDYLRNEVLLESANALGWPDLVDAEVLPPEVKTVTAHTDSTLTVSALVNELPANSMLIFEDGFTRTTSEIALVGATTINFTPDLDTEDPDDKKVLIYYATDQAKVPNPKFVAIADEALRQMGLENIEQINISNIRVFRILGRLELLRRITENRVPTYDKTIDWFDEDRNFQTRTIAKTPSFMSQQLIALYNRELTSLSEQLNPATPVEVPVTGIPAESLSQSSGVSIKW